jgi:hypothetical protein
LHRDLALSQDFAGMPEVCRIGADLIWRRKLLQRLHKHLLQGLPGRRGANRFVRGFTGLFWRRRRAPAAACLAQANPHALAQADPLCDTDAVPLLLLRRACEKELYD